MRKSLWAMAAIGLAGMIALMVLSHSALTTVGGIEEAQGLQETLRATCDHLVEPQPPLLVQRIPGSAEWPGFRWKVEATLRGNWRRSDPAVASASDRMAARALGVTVQGRGAAGVMIVLHSAGEADLLRLYDAEGRVVPAAAPVPPKEGSK